MTTDTSKEPVLSKAEGLSTSTAKLQKTIKTILTQGKGILAADESSGTIKKRFDSIGVENNEQNRRAYRNMLFTTPRYEQYISGVILYDETVDQKSDSGKTFSELIASQGIVPGIKSDEGKEEHPNWDPQTMTRGLKGLGKRLDEWTERSRGTLGFTKWRQVILVEPEPSKSFIDYVMHVMAEQAAWSIAKGYVPICEPEVLMDGSHSLEQCSQVTLRTLATLYQKMKEHGVDPALTILKTNMVLSGKPARSERDRSGGEKIKDPAELVAKSTVSLFHTSVPAKMPGIVFLSGGQSSVQATENLNACALDAAATHAPWMISYSYGRALQDDALKAWGGNAANVSKGQAAFLHRAKMNSLAQQGKWSMEMEKAAALVA